MVGWLFACAFYDMYFYYKRTLELSFCNLGLPFTLWHYRTYLSIRIDLSFNAPWSSKEGYVTFPLVYA